MPPTSLKTKPGPPKLSEIAKHLVAPKDITSTGWPAVEKTCVEKLGITFDPWQVGAGRLILAKRKDGNLAAMVDGVGLSVCRQVGKTYFVGGMTFGLCVNIPGLLVIWSAHHARTHAETFLAMQAYAQRAKVAPHIKQIFTGSGDEEIRFHNGSRILFGARERGFGRGIPGVDILVFDEAQILSDKALSNMLATMNTSRFGLQLYIGTPPKPDDMSEAFTRMRTEAIEGRLTDGAWIELGAQAGVNPNDRKQWPVANPSHPKRTPVQSILRLQRKLTADDFLREGLGVWDDAAKAGAINLADWAACFDKKSQIEGRFVFGLEMPPDRVKVSIGVAGLNEQGRKHLELVEQRRGTEWVAPWFTENEERRSTPVVIDALGPAASLIQLLIDAGVNVLKVNGSEVAQACGALADDIAEHRAAHIGQTELDAAVQGVVKKDRSEAFIWGRKHSTAEISPLYAVTLAARGLTLDPGPITNAGAWSF